MPERRFRNVGTYFAFYLLAGAVVSVVAGWPAQFGGGGDPDRVLAEIFTRGAALTAPAPLLVLLVAFLLLTRRKDRWRIAGVIGTMILSVLTFIGSLGEAFAPATPDVPRAVLIAGGVVGAAFSGAVLGIGAKTLRALRSRIA